MFIGHSYTLFCKISVYSSFIASLREMFIFWIWAFCVIYVLSIFFPYCMVCLLGFVKTFFFFKRLVFNTSCPRNCCLPQGCKDILLLLVLSSSKYRIAEVGFHRSSSQSSLFIGRCLVFWDALCDSVINFS